MTTGKLEDLGKSMLVCDHCDAIFSPFEGRYRDGDDCPKCLANDDPQPARLPGGAN